MKFLLANKGVSIFVVLSISFVFLILVYAPNPQLTYDSRAYIEASQNIDTYFNGSNADGHSYLFRPPVIPIYLHFFEDKTLAAKVLNAICFVLSLWLCYFIGREFKFEPTYLSLFVISVGVSYPWLQNHFFAWSEPLFCTLLLLLIWQIVTRHHWLWIIMLCVLLYFVRKAGLIIAGGIVGSYFIQGEIKKAIILGLVVSFAAVCWESLIWVYSNGAAAQVIFEDTPTEGRLQYLDVLTAWFLPRNVAIATRSIVLCLCAALLVLGLKGKLSELTQDTKIKMIFVIGTVYVLVFVALWRVDYNEAERYLSVIIPVAMLLVISVFRSLCLQRETKKYWLIFFFMWMTYPVGRTLYHLLW